MDTRITHNWFNLEWFDPDSTILHSNFALAEIPLAGQFSFSFSRKRRWIEENPSFLDFYRRKGNRIDDIGIFNVRGLSFPE